MHLNDINDLLKQADQIYNKEQILTALKKQADVINQHLNTLPDLIQPPLILPVMNGGLIYAGQLLPLLTIPVEVDYIHATRYRNTTTGFELDWKVYPQQDLKGRVVIILDDIFDEGLTLQAIVEYCQSQQAGNVLSSVLVTKNHPRREVSIAPDFSALEVADRYVFGFGMDYKGQLRNLDGIYALNN